MSDDFKQATGDALVRLGFTETDDHPAAAPDRVEALSHNGKYEVLGQWWKGNTRVHLEQNTAPNTITDEEGNVFTAAAYQYPAVLVIETVQDDGSSFDPARTMAVSAGDLEAFYLLTGENPDAPVEESPESADVVDPATVPEVAPEQAVESPADIPAPPDAPPVEPTPITSAPSWENPAEPTP